MSASLGFDVGGQREGTDFQLDEDARRRDLANAGLVDITVHHHAWTLDMTPVGTRALFDCLIGVIRLPDDERSAVLDRLEAAAACPGGVDRRPFLTIFYSGRKP